MKLNVKIAMRGYSVNSAYTRNLSLCAAARRWKMEFAKCMKPYTKECVVFSEQFKPLEHEVHAHVVYYLTNLITNEGKVSHASGDVDNYNKFALDGIFASIPNIDDCAVTRLLCEKKLGPADYINITLSLEPIIKDLSTNYDV